MRWKPLPLALTLAVLAGSRALIAQETPPADPAPAAEGEKKERPTFRPIESNTIINLPSVEVPREGTMTFFVTHRFRVPLQDSDVYNLFSLDDGADVGLGLGYVPFKNLDVSFYRSSFSSLGAYELAGKYQMLDGEWLKLALRVGDDIRTAKGLADRSTFFVQAIAALQLGSRVRLTAVPTYLTKTAGQSGYSIPGGPNGLPLFVVTPEPVYRDVFNFPVGASIALTHSITVHGEVVPSYRRTEFLVPFCTATPCDQPVAREDSPGIGWRVSVEKALLRHRFAFTVGNLQETTVDQYLISNFGGFPRNIRIGFNLMRQWKVK